MLKYVSARRKHAALPTETEHCDALVQKFPALLSDPQLAFPHSAIRLVSEAGGEHLGDLLVSREALGEQIGRCIAMAKGGEESARRRVEVVCAQLGALLADFHRKYADPVSGEATHHRDFHPSNVLYDEPTGTITIVDLCDMGRDGPRDDVERFAKVLRQWNCDCYASAFTKSYAAHVANARSGALSIPASKKPGLWLGAFELRYNCLADNGSDVSSDEDSSGSELDGHGPQQCALM